MLSDVLAYVGLALDAGAALGLAVLPFFVSKHVEDVARTRTSRDRGDVDRVESFGRRVGVGRPPLLPERRVDRWMRRAEDRLARRWIRWPAALLFVGFVFQLLARALA